ncbi:MAG TPA: single-stranded-DNA-specific exonuclease RecJ [Solirubrobacteraceae bacterium]|nr:single-stranded-DNA-specific exonuclease RecJ [Solirubrobacteraceae bacterium]
MTRLHTRFTVPPYDYAAARRLAGELGVSHVLAQVLVRRGFGEVEAARAFLAAEESHPLDAFGGLRAAAARVLEHVGRRSRITVHGDYDVDGVTATAVLVRVLRTVGADVDWYLPSRIDDGYGLASSTVERLAARGTDLLITVDCAITAVEEVAAARAAGLDVVVTDHHSPRADGRLPDAPIVHPGVGGYPCAALCAAGVAYKLAAALLEGAGEDPALADEDLDLVALATVADVVPLVGENRRLVRQGLRALAATRKPGLRALMAVARVDPGALDASAIGFRLAPRINAAGRLHRADAGLELLLTEDPARARAIAAELDAVNTERRDVETRMRFAAEALVAEQGPAPAYVLAAEGWHPGVIGIVAARIAERHHRPTVLIALDGEEGTGSGRSIPAFDLLGGLTAAGGHLERYGGHRAAAGLTIARGDVDAFREAFAAHAAEVLTPDDLVPECRVDAVVPGDALTLGLAEELERLAPFGQGNPAVSLLVPAAELTDPRAMGEGRHVAFTLHAGGARSRCVQFGAGSQLPVEPGEPVDAAVRLEANRWNGAVEPRLVLRHARPSRPAPIEIVGEPPFHAGLEAELARDLSAAPAVAARQDVVAAGPLAVGGLARDVRGIGIAGLLADLVAAGEPVLAVVAHAPHRARTLRSRIGGFAVCSWGALEDDPSLVAGFAHLVAVDPPADPAALPRLQRLSAPPRTHLAWGEPELRFARRIHQWDFALRDPLTALYRGLRGAGDVRGEAFEAALRGEGPQPRSAALAGRLVRVLSELDLVVLDREGPALRLTETPARTALERSAAFQAYHARLEDGLRFLTTDTIRKAA